MISVATSFDLDRNPSSFFPMEIPRVSSSASPDPESRAYESIDLSLSVHGFKTGDMVWGKVKSHPWWPGLIYNEAFATPSVRRSRQGNQVLVAFFGDSSYGWFDPSELIPFSPNFPEKSKQTTLRSFLVAVEEAVDEFSCRAALGLTCKCRNPKNFRPRKVPNYFAVDVPGFERGGIYSADQIVRAREEFVPRESLAFVRQLALAPTVADTSDAGWVKRVSVALAYRGATYEEFDVPYLEAFGVQLERPARARDSQEEEPEKFAPRVAPFSGPLVTAEAVGNIDKSSNSKKSYFQKHSSTRTKKKNKYLLKKRDGEPSSRDGESSSSTTSTLPDGYSQTVLLHTLLPPPPPDPKTIEDDDNERKREPTSSTPPLAEAEMSVTAMPALPVAQPPAVPVHGGKVNEEDKTKKKRPREHVDFDDNKELLIKEKRERKKKKIEELLAQGSVASTFKEDSRPELTRTPGPDVPKIDIGPLDFPMLLDRLKVLAVEPYYGVERHVPSVVGDVFLKFRSLVYEKSLVLPLASETDDQEIRPHKPKERSHATKEPKEQSEKTPKVKMGSLFNRSGDPAKAGGKKRAPISDRREEEISVKQLRKMAATTPPPVCLEDKKAVLTPTNPSSSADLARTRTLPLLPKKPSPTNLILKFPPRSALPSIPNLKARFARFGQLIVDRCRVIWDTHSCRVQYKYKADALAAYNYAKDNNLFGQIPVKYIVREVELPSSKSEPESSEPLMPGHGNGNGNSLSQSRPKYKPAPLKSILKKPGEDVVKENQRVKFKLAGDDRVMPSVSVGVGLPKFPSPPPPSFVSLSKPTAFVPTSLPRTSLQPPKHTTLLSTAADAVARPGPTRPPLPASLLPYRPSLTPPRGKLQSPPSPVITREVVLLQQYSGGGGGGGSAEESKKNGKSREVSDEMLSILHRCNDIITVLHSLPGFSPYRPL